MAVESVAGCTWNGWPDAHGIGGRMAAEYALRRHLEDLADTYAHIEAELWAGWRSDFEDDQRRLKEV